MNHRWIGSVVALGTLAGAACASAPPPRELLDARVTYVRAATGRAAQINPSAVHDAKIALDNAESSYSQNSDSDVTRDKAYVAIRKAELAEIVASTELTRRNEAPVHPQTLLEAREQLATAEQRLETTGQHLESDKEARAATERKAREALDNLSIENTLAVRDEPRGTVITVPSGALFASGKADLLPGAPSTLEPVAEALSQEQGHRIVIEGHTDSQGSDASNVVLSQRRAQVVRDFFVSHGVQDRIAAAGVGETRPIADNATAEGRANNRRIEIVIQPVEVR